MANIDLDNDTETESHPFLPISPETGRPHRPRHSRSPRRSRWRNLLVHPRAFEGRILVLSSSTILSSLVYTLYFQFPSTLHVYLSFLFVAIPISLLFDLCSFAVDRGKNWSRTRTAWFWFTFLTALVLILPSLLLPSRTVLSVISPTSLASSRSTLPDFPRNDTYFFASNLYNSAHLFPQFSSSLLALIATLGEANVFVSIYESNSKDATKTFLAALDTELRRRGVRTRIKMDDIGQSQRHDKEEWESINTRIDYLARVRNEALRPLDEGLTGLDGRNFTRVVWFNDIFYDWQSVLELFNTHGGQFDLACAFDYIPLGFYDTWVARDLCGDRVKPLWPYFSHPDDVEFLRDDEPVPVNSCWSGIAAFDAKYFSGSGNGTILYPDSPRNTTLTRPSAVPTHPNASVNYTLPTPSLPLRFRYDSVCVASECLLTALDIHRVEHPRRPRIYMNPRVSATYEYPSYLMYNKLMRWRIVDPWKFLWQDLVSYRLFGWVSEVGRKEALCRNAFRTAWAPPPETRFCPRR